MAPSVDLTNSELMRLTDPLVPRGWESMTITTVDGRKYSHYNYKKVSDERVTQDKCGPLVGINNIHYPLGQMGGLDKDDMVLRCIGYFPVGGFFAGIKDIVDSIQMIYYRVIKHSNTLSRWETTRDDANRILITTRHIHPVDLSLNKKLAIVGLGISLFVRGLLTFCQVGVIFLPFDMLADRCLVSARRQHVGGYE